eukprot:CAMPEP_0182475786 /NCGR_PEP_ID=MMETSP1319-20130603/27947_1 /TAXON_ID=172717 /ORGANISM="Bolidomonas pacifica, Strain RCC208" /LENGTH=499 /DNA_ID=CAMNT_0024676813 /DNA_START=99 /DNA_END=1595 /DNA_ORIENTATION=+
MSASSVLRSSSNGLLRNVHKATRRLITAPTATPPITTTTCATSRHTSRTFRYRHSRNNISLPLPSPLHLLSTHASDDRLQCHHYPQHRFLSSSSPPPPPPLPPCRPPSSGASAASSSASDVRRPRPGARDGLPPTALTRWGSPQSAMPSDDVSQSLLTSSLSTSASLSTVRTVRLALLGNLLITLAKAGAYASSGSSALLSEAVHSLVDSGNQALLLLGLRDVGRLNDSAHPYGYGKSIYFWSLVSALGTFWLGAGVSMTHSVQHMLEPALMQEIGWEVWGVLGFSLAVDGYVLSGVVSNLKKTKPPGLSFLSHARSIRDPATLAVLLEDGAACTGVLLASLGLAASHATGNPLYDGVAGCAVSALLAGMGLTLAQLNRRYLLGQAVDNKIVSDINSIILGRPGIDGVSAVQSQWTGPYAFSYKAEIDLDGTYLAARLVPRYRREFLEASGEGRLEKDLDVLLSWYAEDVTRAAETEIKAIESAVRAVHPMAAYIELEP